MRKVREVLRLKHALGMSERLIAEAVGAGKSAVGRSTLAQRACSSYQASLRRPMVEAEAESPGASLRSSAISASSKVAPSW